jgi:hypothetical protein
MDQVIDRPPTLPPFLRKRPQGPERGKWIIIPYASCWAEADVVREVDKGWKTLVFRRMARYNTETGDVTVTHIATRLYRQWLEIHEIGTELPPHIVFGGAETPDPTTHERWTAYAKLTFC